MSITEKLTSSSPEDISTRSSTMTPEEILNWAEKAPTPILKKAADLVCRTHHGDKVWLRGLVEISNTCIQNCLYCGIRRDNEKVNRYRLTEEQIIETVKTGYDAGLRTFVLQGGEDGYFNAQRMERLIGNIKNLTLGEAALTLSLGIFSKEVYKRWKKAGADRYLIRFETSDPDLHLWLRDGVTLKERLEALKDLKDLGYETGSGFMVGLPRETAEIRRNNALLCRELELDMVGIGPFIPHPQTPLKEAPQESMDLCERSVATVRLLLPKAHMPATTAAGSLDKKGREKVLAGGANVLMPNITPVMVEKDYELYPGKICLDESGLECMDCLDIRVRTVGKRLSKGKGGAWVKVPSIEVSTGSET